MIKKRKIGKTDLAITPFVLGGNVFGWTADEKTSFEILDAYTDAGFDFIDTANVYSAWAPGNKGGESETIIGNWLKKTGKRDKVTLSTKVGAKIKEGHEGLKKDYIFREIDNSLKRLNTDHVDLYFSHYDDLSTPIEETLDAYNKLIKAGKVRYIGASNISPERISESLEAGKTNGLNEYVCIQPEYNLYERKTYEENYKPLAEKYNLGVITYYSLAGGFLTGKYKSVADLSKSKRGGNIEKYLNERGMHIITVLTDIAEKYNADPAQIAPAWLLAQPSVTAPIASVSKTSQLDILKCVNIELDTDSINKLTKAGKY